ncbi:MAG: 3-hydroxyacyl-CoA dehydrogenase [Sterolibacterium sp.]|nr:3-hydroxyacyl-CoA dehydrogenase [Sterolibacterium sp.]
MKIKDSVFIISGGASGLGAATAQRFVAGGARVVLMDLNDKEGNALAATLGANARFIKTNVVEEADVLAAIAMAKSEFGGLNGAISCAGIGPAEKTVGKDKPHSFDVFKRVVGVNLFGTFNVVRLAAFEMNKNAPNEDGERGVIVNTASVAAYEGQIGQVAYAASKGGIVSMTLPVARDLSRSGIRICTIAPGLFETPLLGTLPEEVRKSLAANVPFPSRLGHPDEYAQLAQQIVENPMLNGETIRLDGALRMAPR